LVATTTLVVGAVLVDVEVTRADEDAADELLDKDDKVDPADETPRGVVAALLPAGGKPIRIMGVVVLPLLAPDTALPCAAIREACG